jgi:hypothetical protein
MATLSIPPETSVIYPKQSETEVEKETETESSVSKINFSLNTRKIPVLLFWIFLGLSVFVAGAIAHNRNNWQSFWNQEAVLDRRKALKYIPLGSAIDSLATWMNSILVKGGWIVAAAVLVLVQMVYIVLTVSKRDRAPALRDIRNFPVRRMIVVELSVLVAGTLYFIICTWTFTRISEQIGSCSAIDPKFHFKFPVGRDSCANPLIFRGFDISGHCFLIVHSCLLAVEYLAKMLFVWKCRTSTVLNDTSYTDKDSDLEYAISDEIPHEADDFAQAQHHLPQLNNHLNRNRSTYKAIIFCTVFAVILLCVLELLIFLQTILFYHTVLEKILGTLIGAGFWIALFILSIRYPYLF